MDVEETFDHIGHFGIYQLGMFVLTALMSVEAALQTLSTIFLHVRIFSYILLFSVVQHDGLVSKPRKSILLNVQESQKTDHNTLLF